MTLSCRCLAWTWPGPGLGLSHSPCLQLIHSVAAGVEIVMMGDRGQIGRMAAFVTLVGVGPGQEFQGRVRLSGSIGGQRNRHLCGCDPAGCDPAGCPGRWRRHGDARW